MREKSIFYNLTSENENTTTELLCNLCCNEEYRKIILNALGIKDLKINFEDIQTQKQIPKKRKLPDIIIENNEIKIIIENKINRYYGLLKSQTEIYPKDLVKSNKIKKLIYLIPKDYKYISKITNLSEKYSFVSKVFWEDIINELEMYNKEKRAEIINESITLLNKILRMNPKIIFTEEDISFMNNVEVFRTEINTMAKQAELFSNVIEKIIKNLNLSKIKSLACEADAFGYYFFNDNCFLGYSFGLLDNENNEEKDCVLSLAVHKEAITNKIKDYKDNSYYFDEEWYFFKFPQDILTNNDKETLLSNQCENIFKAVIKLPR